mmetsp:Transcript_15060/g.25074  ORF Transcript_15060/g.25074 Transcript_15060/m.25074 type:complete len:227 (-) Transcript_15060:1946-2626(-)
MENRSVKSSHERKSSEGEKLKTEVNMIDKALEMLDGSMGEGSIGGFDAYSSVEMEDSFDMSPRSMDRPAGGERAAFGALDGEGPVPTPEPKEKSNKETGGGVNFASVPIPNSPVFEEKKDENKDGAEASEQQASTGSVPETLGGGAVMGAALVDEGGEGVMDTTQSPSKATMIQIDDSENNTSEKKYEDISIVISTAVPDEEGEEEGEERKGLFIAIWGRRRCQKC